MEALSVQNVIRIATAAAIQASGVHVFGVTLNSGTSDCIDETAFPSGVAGQLPQHLQERRT